MSALAISYLNIALLVQKTESDVWEYHLCSALAYKIKISTYIYTKEILHVITMAA